MRAFEFNYFCPTRISRQNRVWTLFWRCVILLFIIVVLLLQYKYMGNGIDISTAHLMIPTIDPAIQLTAFKPDVQSDFLVSFNDTPVIPFIIHQVYQDVNIPQNVATFVHTVVNKNTNWTYYFWTDDASKRLIANRLQRMLPIWDKIKRGVFRGDIIRYVVLYEFGGAYLDLDVEVLRPLDVITMKYPCIIPPEPFEHNVLLYNRELFLNNAIMFCRPKHPFFKMVIDQLINVFEHDFNHDISPVGITGPGMLTSVYEQYIKRQKNSHTFNEDNSEDKSPSANAISLSTIDPDSVFIPNTQYFTENIDTKLQAGPFLKTCLRRANETLIRRACAEISRKGFIRTPNKYAFTIHHYVHSWMGFQKFLKNYFRWITGTVSITDIAPKCIIY